MITIKGELKDIVQTINNGFILTITTNTSNLSAEDIKSLHDAKNGLKIDISQWREKRSLDSNAYAWKLMDEIAKKIKSTKEDIYKSIIHKVGVFEILPIKNVAVQSFVKKWSSKGLGWLCEIERESTIPNYTVVTAYYGTSTYNTEEMSRFIDEITFEAKELGIQTLDDIELKSLIDDWEKRNENQG